MKIWFDMDGTFVNLYGELNWLTDITAKNPAPYKNATPLFNMNSFARILNRLQKQGFEIGIISWLAKNSTADYDAAVTTAKKTWIKNHLHSVTFDTIHIVKYGTPKDIFRENSLDILFDDEENNRKNWNGIAYPAENILETLKGLT